MPVKRSIFYKYLGHVLYSEALILQEELHKSVLSGTLGMDGCMLFLSHEPVITFGKYSSEKNLLVDEDRLTELGVNLYRSSRGGDITCHEPGQLVVYPVLNLKKLHLGVKEYVGMLEKAVIGFLSEFGISGETVKGRPGVWVGNNKIASIGINISKFVTTHGIAINIFNSLQSFGYVNPCGFSDIGITSVKHLNGECDDLEKAGIIFLKHFETVFNVSVVEYQQGTMAAGNII